jgi:hypothetical protein
MDFELDCPVGCFWLFAYGGSTNPVTLRLRNITPIRSYPAILPDWKLEFAGVGGLATITRSSGCLCHGVLHLLPDAALPVQSVMYRCFQAYSFSCVLFSISEC